MNAVTHHEGGALSTSPTQQAFSLAPRNLDEAFRLADMLAQSDLVPKDFKGKPGNVMIAMQWGFEVGLKPLQSLQNIAVINGRPSMWGDAVLALVRASPLCEYVLEDMDAAGTASCRVKRRGEPEQTRTFSDLDAKVAGLLGKGGPWATSPKRMKQMRARSFALRDVFPDVLKGMDIAEAVMDHTELPATANRVPAATHQHPEPPQQLVDSAKAAAERGVATYQAFWQHTGKDNRGLLAKLHEGFKSTAIEADKARTVDAPAPPSEPEKPAAPAIDAETGEIDPFLAALDNAEREQQQ